jgi:dynein heavy chain
MGGKSACYVTLKEAMTLMNKNGSEKFFKVQTVILNPKSITMGQLYGDSAK